MVNLIQEFLKHEAVAISAVGTDGNQMALMWDRLWGQSTLASELLVLDGVNVLAKNKAGSTALDIAYGLEQFDIATCLEDHSEECLKRYIFEVQAKHEVVGDEVA